MPDKLTFSDMTWDLLAEHHGIQEAESQVLFRDAPPIEPSPTLVETLRRGRRARLVNERARAYYLIHPVISEVEMLREGRITPVPEILIQVPGAEGLCGRPDYVISGTTTHKIVPIMAIVEAKHEDMEGGLQQCVAELYAAHLLNGKRPARLYGCVTTGTDWQFAELEVSGETKLARRDKGLYLIAELPRLLGAFCHGIDHTLHALGLA